VLAVPGAVEQIIDNFVDNAMAVTPSGGRIDVVVQRSPGGLVAADGAAGRAAIAVHVRDTGPGMTDEQLARAFDRFWRAPGSATSGSGLGLAIVAQLATASGAVATIAHRPGGGIDAAVAFRAADQGQASNTANVELR
jgi:signal transduction histidine kinase